MRGLSILSPMGVFLRMAGCKTTENSLIIPGFTAKKLKIEKPRATAAGLKNTQVVLDFSGTAASTTQETTEIYQFSVFITTVPFMLPNHTPLFKILFI